MNINDVNPELKKYIETQIFPLYELNGESHGINHIQDVIRRTFEIVTEYMESEEYKNSNIALNPNILYIVAAYHDIGDHIDRKKHHIISGEIMCIDSNLDEFISVKEKQIAKEAIEDHRASLDKHPRSIYGRIILTADRNNELDVFFMRRIMYCLEKHPEYSVEEVQEEVYTSANKKFGKEGYAIDKDYMPSQKLSEYLKTIKELLLDKKRFNELVYKYYNAMMDNLNKGNDEEVQDDYGVVIGYSNTGEKKYE